MRERKRSTVLARYSEMYKLNNRENNLLARNIAILQCMPRYISFFYLEAFCFARGFYFDTDVALMITES